MSREAGDLFPDRPNLVGMSLALIPAPGPDFEAAACAALGLAKPDPRFLVTAHNQVRRVRHIVDCFSQFFEAIRRHSSGHDGEFLIGNFEVHD